MAGNILWASGAVIANFPLQLSGQGAQLTNGSAVLLSGVYNNTGVSGGPALFADVEFFCAQSGFGGNVTTQQNINFYLVPSRDGTNFPSADATNASLPPKALVGAFITVQSGNTQFRDIIEGVPLMPVAYRGYIINNTGQTLASGWTILMNTYCEAYT